MDHYGKNVSHTNIELWFGYRTILTSTGIRLVLPSGGLLLLAPGDSVFPPQAPIKSLLVQSRHGGGAVYL